MGTVKNLFLFFLFAAVVTAFFTFLFPSTKSETATVVGEYTGGELIDFAAAIHCDITAVVSANEVVLEKSDTDLTCQKSLLNYKGEAVFIFGADHTITKVYFIFPADTPWNDVSNRISEQLGEPSTATLYDSGSADAQWENEGYLFYLATNNDDLTLSVTKYYGDND